MGARRLAGAVLLALLLALAASGSALADEQLSASGSLTLAWHGNPAGGCAQIGVCGVSGTLVVTPTDDASLARRPHGTGVLGFDAVAATARVTGSGPGVCVDATEGDVALDNGSLNMRLDGAGHLRTSLGDLSSGRCAGPLPGGFGRVSLPVRRSGGARPSFAITGTAPFAVGPWTGTVTSTLRLVPDPTDNLVISSGSSTSSSGGPPSTRTVRLEQVTLKYRVSAPATTIVYAFAGQADPFCAAFDICGARGALALALPAVHGNLSLVLSRQVAHRLSPGRILRDLRAGRLALAAPAPLSVRVDALTEHFAGGAGFLCQATRPLGPDLLTGFAGGFSSSGVRTVPFSVQVGGDGTFLRTDCPGPQAGDVYPNFANGDGTAELVGGAASLRSLLAPRTTVILAAGGSFAGLGYTGTRSGTVSLELTRVSVRAAMTAQTEVGS